MLGAAYAAIWPLLWVLALGFDLPLAETVPPSLWHAHEMLVGAFGAALIGFLTTAVPEWTDTEPLCGRLLWGMAALWGIGRAVGLLGWDGMGAVGAIADLAWMVLLLGYALRLSWQRRTDRLLAFAFWLALVLACTATVRTGFVLGNIDLAERAVDLIGFAYLGLLGMALARITVPVTNLILDPTEETSPFRPHPGRLHLAPGLVLVAMAGEVAGLSPAVSAFLLIAAGAAFMDRVSEAFIGRAAVRAEILLLAGASAASGLGLMMAGAARLPPSATAMNTQRSVSRYGTSGRTADWVSERTFCATSTPAAPSVATPAAPPPFMLRLSPGTSRAGRASSAKAVARIGNRSPRFRAGPRSTWMKPERG